MSRLNVEVDDALIARVMARYGLRSKQAAIDLALHRLDAEPMSREEALAMRGRGWSGDLEAFRGAHHRSA
jgi:Arc/MetJ family transcription regulator